MLQAAKIASQTYLGSSRETQIDFCCLLSSEVILSAKVVAMMLVSMHIVL